VIIMNDILKELIDTDEEIKALIELGYTIEEDHEQPFLLICEFQHS